jgi:hypothetical protein
MPSQRGLAAVDRAYYSGSISEFLHTPSSEMEGKLAVASISDGFPPLESQLAAWRGEISVLKSSLEGRQGKIYLEFAIPRMGRRADAVLLLDSTILVLEFKVGAAEFLRSARDQVWDYALDLKNFHESSHDSPIVPVVVATGAPDPPEQSEPPVPGDRVWPPLLATPATLSSLLDKAISQSAGEAIDPIAWEAGRYSPTPTIIEAALALYSRHSVIEISRSDAGARNLSETSRALEQIIQNTRSRGEKAICFVTGVPGAGKTLVGLNIATTYMDPESELYSVYLSGNGPLVSVLSEALARDRALRLRRSGAKTSLVECRSEVKAFIQNVHHFRDEYWQDRTAPVEHVTIFDEAQRAWTLEQTSKFMARRKNVPGFGMSEPEFLLSCMDRHEDWSVVICLIGAGQEINTGEAGMPEWVAALGRSFPRWRVFLSDRLGESEYGSREASEALRVRDGVVVEPALHLSTSMRSFRAEKVSDLVRCVLEIDAPQARRLLGETSRYPILVTRQVSKARDWLRDRTRGSERAGIVVSSQAQRLKPHAIDVRAAVDPVQWFLYDRSDTRSSCYLEDAATEFQVQGLELDWTGVVWDADLRFREGGWEHWSFGGSKWSRIRKPERRRYLTNAYRVLLTRARQGMVVVVPQGDTSDPTRLPEFYDPTYAYLTGIGIPAI